MLSNVYTNDLEHSAPNHYIYICDVRYFVLKVHVVSEKLKLEFAAVSISKKVLLVSKYFSVIFLW